MDAELAAALRDLDLRVLWLEKRAGLPMPIVDQILVERMDEQRAQARGNSACRRFARRRPRLRKRILTSPSPVSGGG
jgi:hypothetical protein